MTASAQGRDYSAFQELITAGDLNGLSFALTKATDGMMTEDRNFAHNWAVIRSAGKHRGAYHELWSASAASSRAQADHFLTAVRAQQLRPGDMLAVVASDYRGVTDAEVLAFADTVKADTGGRNPVLIYTDLNFGKTLTRTAAAYPDTLWVAWPSPTAPLPAQWAPAPWKTWRFWQWGQPGGVDADAYNGTRTALDTWIATFTRIIPTPPVPAWQEAMMHAFPVVKQGATGEVVRTIQGACCARAGQVPAAEVKIDGVFGPKTAAAVKAVQLRFLGPAQADGIVGQYTWPALLGVA